MGDAPKIEYLKTDSGGYLVFSADFDIADQLRRRGVHDRPVIELALTLLGEEDRGADRALVDVGAHLGTFAIPVSKATGLSVQAFEAQRPISQLLGANFLLSEIGNAWVHHVALGAPDQPDTVSIPAVNYALPGNYGALSVDQDIFADRSSVRLQTTGQVEQVPRRTLDSFALQNVALVKIDVEGQELAVLKGAVETLRSNGWPPILFECWDNEDYRALRSQTIAFVEALGYVCEATGENIAARKA